MAKFNKHLKWIIPVLVVVIIAGVLVYLYASNPERQKLA